MLRLSPEVYHVSETEPMAFEKCYGSNACYDVHRVTSTLSFKHCHPPLSHHHCHQRNTAIHHSAIRYQTLPSETLPSTILPSDRYQTLPSTTLPSDMSNTAIRETLPSTILPSDRYQTLPSDIKHCHPPFCHQTYIKHCHQTDTKHCHSSFCQSDKQIPSTVLILINTTNTIHQFAIRQDSHPQNCSMKKHHPPLTVKAGDKKTTSLHSITIPK